MAEHIKDILCPDCNEEYIDKSRLKEYGKCLKCQRRETMCRTKQMEYVPYVNLPEDEKARLKKLRADRLRWGSHKEDKPTQVTPVEVKRTFGGPTIYTPDVIEKIKTVANEQIGVSELSKIVQSMFPEKKITVANLNYVVKANNIAHKCKANKVVHTAELKTVEEADKQVQEDNEEVFIPQEYVEDIDTTPYPEANDVIDESAEPARFIPIHEEVTKVLEKKCKSLGCNLERNPQTTDYVDLLDTLLYLCENVDKIIKARRDQYDVINAYQGDCLHEMENEVAAEGDTYLSDKMHVIRNRRRYYEYDCNDLLQMRRFLQSVDVSSLKISLGQLKRAVKTRQNPKFIPLIDTSLVKKYDWAINGTLASPKMNKPILITNLKANKTVATPATQAVTTPTPARTVGRPKKLKTFRVSCELSGGGFGAFKKWHKDYSCITEDIAMSYAEQDLSKLKEAYKGLLVTKLDVHLIDIGDDNV
jgi:hypothetical protein